MRDEGRPGGGGVSALYLRVEWLAGPDSLSLSSSSLKFAVAALDSLADLDSLLDLAAAEEEEDPRRRPRACEVAKWAKWNGRSPQRPRQSSGRPHSWLLLSFDTFVSFFFFSVRE